MQDGARPDTANVVLDFLHALSTRVPSQTDILIVLHVDRAGPPE
jgi:hypothetical protein